MRLYKLKPFIGIAIMLVALAGMYLWETKGREAALTEQVITVIDEIEAGGVLEESALSRKAYLRENVAEGALLAGEESFAVGLRTKVDLHSGMQLNEAYLVMPGEPEEGMSCFAISRSDISHMSPSLRAGDTVDFYAGDLSEKIGRFRIAYVRNEKGQPVTEIDGSSGSDIFSRGESTGEIEAIEIIADIDEYGEILSYTSSFGGIVVVQVSEEQSE